MSPARKTNKPIRRRQRGPKKALHGKLPVAPSSVLIDAGYDALREEVAWHIQQARAGAVRAVNAIMTATYWLIGRDIIQFEQLGHLRAEYGEELLARLAEDLTARFGRGFAKSNLYQMRAFYRGYPDIFQTPSGESPLLPSHWTRLGRSEQDARRSLYPMYAGVSGMPFVQVLAERFRLPWSAYVRLLSVKDELARRFYELEALRGGWTTGWRSRTFRTTTARRTGTGCRATG